MSQNAGRIPSLDGIRAVSILMVIVGHLSGTAGFVKIPAAEGYAEFGVRVFFIISGFLITSILLEEWQNHASIDLKRFYVRRAYRIFPAAYVFMLAVFVVSWQQLNPLDMWTAATYTSNYHPRPWVLAHLWSLAVEEQFYLLWPAVLAYGFRHRTRVLVGVIVATPVLNVALHYFQLADNVVGFWFPTVADGLAMGCLLAIAQPLLRRYDHIFCRPQFLLVTLATVATPALVLPDSRMEALAYTLVIRTMQNLGIALAIHNAVLMRWRVLNWRPVAWVGLTSYSLYLWQQLFLNRGSGAPWTAFPLNLMLAFACAALSYYLVETPALRLRARCSKAQSEPVLDRAPAESLPQTARAEMSY